MKDIPLRGWGVLVACAFVPAVTFGILIAGFPFWVPAWMETFHVSLGTVMVAFAVGGVAASLFAPLVARALDFMSVRTAVAVGALMMAVGVALTAYAQTFWQVLVLYATLVPLGSALAGVLPLQTLATRMYPQHAGMVNGIVSVGMTLGGALMAICATPLLAAFGWRGAFLVFAAVLTLAIAPLAWFIFHAPAGKPVGAHQVGGLHGGQGDGPNPMKTTIFWVLLLTFLPGLFAVVGLPPHFTAIAADLILPAGAAALMVTVFSISSAVGSLAGGWLVDRLEHWLFYLIAITVNAICLTVLALSPGMAVIMVVLTVFGLAGGSMLPWLAAVVARRFGPAAFAKVLGMIIPFFVAGMLFPMVAAWIRETTGSYQAVFLMFAALVAAGGLLTPLLREARPATAPSQT